MKAESPSIWFLLNAASSIDSSELGKEIEESLFSANAHFQIVLTHSSIERDVNHFHLKAWAHIQIISTQSIEDGIVISVSEQE